MEVGVNRLINRAIPFRNDGIRDRRRHDGSVWTAVHQEVGAGEAAVDESERGDLSVVTVWKSVVVGVLSRPRTVLDLVRQGMGFLAWLMVILCEEI